MSFSGSVFIFITATMAGKKRAPAPVWEQLYVYHRGINAIQIARFRYGFDPLNQPQRLARLLQLALGDPIAPKYSRLPHN